MLDKRSPTNHSQSSLRLWPGVAIVAAQWLARFGLPQVWPDGAMFAVIGGLLGFVGVLIWWLFFSRAAWFDRIAAVVIMFAALAATFPFLHVSVATGAMGMLFPMLAVPGLCLAFVIWAAVSRPWLTGLRRATMVAAIVLPCLLWTLVRTGGFTGGFDNDLAWRWTPTPEDRVLALRDDTPPPPPPVVPAEPPVAAPAPATPITPVAVNAIPAPADSVATKTEAPPSAVPAREPVSASPDWPGFRGRDRDSAVRGVRIATDWSSTPPKELWRRPIGPGWSSFAVHGDVFFTQEQRGEEEIVAAYRVSTGAPIWKHRDNARFWESNGGAGPRGTPTLHNGRVYAFGATGILNVLDEATGHVIWSRNAGTDSDTKIPDWGFSASPLLIDDLVMVAVAGKLVAYDRETGTRRWVGPDGGPGYSSPHLLTIQGVPQVVLLAGTGATSVAPSNGARLWNVTVTTGGMAAPIVQPAMTADGDVLISAGDLSGLHRFAVTNSGGAWAATSRWSTNGLKPYFNDFVLHKGHAFGFDGSLLACIDVADGKRKWKGGRYGNGQLVLLPDQDLLLVVTEEGELALASAASDKFTELARIPAINGKTWNHPVLAGNVLLVRNGEEMAAFRLETEASSR
jgi:outer membrane protein assembly factor BamB